MILPNKRDFFEDPSDVSIVTLVDSVVSVRSIRKREIHVDFVVYENASKLA